MMIDHIDGKLTEQICKNTKDVSGRLCTKMAGAIILFHPTESVMKNVQSYLADAEVLYLIDNSPGSHTSLIASICRHEKVKYISAKKNIGIAAALNIAAQSAIQEGYKYLLTMDQDSAFAPNMLPKMLKYAIDDSIGIIAPFHQDRNVPKPIPQEETEYVLVTMTSGNLLNLTVYQKVGGFLEKLFIDCVDTEYCLRLHTMGYRILRINNAVLSHSLGSFTVRRFLGSKVYPYNHNPIRIFYQTRNRFYLLRIYGMKFPKYFFYDMKLFLGGILKIILFEKQPLKKLEMIFQGFVAFCKNDFSVLETTEGNVNRSGL
jgi:rhamnosyltransferase